MGEHIPPQFNRPFVANLVSHARKGMVLSWSNVCDKGVGHVNCKSEDQVIGMMRAQEFNYDAKATGLLRNVTVGLFEDYLDGLPAGLTRRWRRGDV